MSKVIRIEQANGPSITLDKSKKDYVLMSVGDQILSIEKANILPLCEMLLLMVKKEIKD